MDLNHGIYAKICTQPSFHTIYIYTQTYTPTTIGVPADMCMGLMVRLACGVMRTGEDLKSHNPNSSGQRWAQT